MPAHSHSLAFCFTSSLLKDSPYYFEDENRPCYSEILNFNEAKVFDKLQIEPYFMGGQRKWIDFLRTNLDTSLAIDFSVQDDSELIDTVFVKFIVRREGGLSNIMAVSYKYEKLKEKSIRLLKLSCKYWAPANFSGRNVNGFYQQSFIFRLRNEMFASMPKLKIINLFPISVHLN